MPMNREDLLTRLRRAHKALVEARDALKDVSLEAIEAEGDALRGLSTTYYNLGIERKEVQEMVDTLILRGADKN